MKISKQQSTGALTSAQFKRRFLWLIVLTWNLPPVVGLGFILLIGVLTPAQLLGILITPLEPAYIIGWSAFSIWFFPRLIQPMVNYLEQRTTDSISPVAGEEVLRAVRRFPFWYWGLFLFYLVLAPLSVVVAAEIYTDFVTTPLALFRIELVALIVSIIVGLPIFFLILDLFGEAMGGLVSERPIVTIRTKVFLIGALIPLLIDTMLVQYFWTRTGYFTTETFMIWLFLELLAIAGSLVFARSFGQSLRPLQAVIDSKGQLWELKPEELQSRSTDELGLLISGFRGLLEELQVHNQILEINNRILRGGAESISMQHLATTIIDTCMATLPSDSAFLILFDEESGELVGVAQDGLEYRPQGYFRIGLDETSMAVMTFKQDGVIAIDDVSKDARVSQKLRARFNVKSAVAGCIQLSGKKLGVLMSVTQSRCQHYTDQQLKLFEALVGEAALAINTQVLEDARREEEERLERLVEERTIHLDEARMDAIKANRAKSEFLSRMSHELRTPLNAVLGYAQILELDKTNSPEKRSNIQQIIEGGEHLLSLIEEVMDLSRIEMGKISIVREVLDLQPVIEKAIRFIKPQAEARNISVEYWASGSLTVNADKIRIEEVILNLLSNAVKYNHDNGHIHINATKQDNGQVCISVRDTGAGLNDEQQAMLFEPFSRLGAEYSGVEGTGIGLTIVKSLVELMQGRIEVESEVGKGTTFTVCLPQHISKD